MNRREFLKGMLGTGLAVGTGAINLAPRAAQVGSRAYPARRVFNQGLKDLANAAKSLNPVETGLLRDSMKYLR